MHPIVVIIILLLLVVGAGAGYWYMTKKSTNEPKNTWEYLPHRWYNGKEPALNDEFDVNLDDMLAKCEANPKCNGLFVVKASDGTTKYSMRSDSPSGTNMIPEEKRTNNSGSYTLTRAE